MQNTKKSTEAGPSLASKKATNEVGHDDFQNIIEEQLSQFGSLMRQGRSKELRHDGGLIGVGEDPMDSSGSDLFQNGQWGRNGIANGWMRFRRAPSRFGGNGDGYRGAFDRLAKRKFDRLMRAAYDRSIKAAFDTTAPIDDDYGTSDLGDLSRDTRSGFNRLMRAAYDRSIKQDMGLNMPSGSDRNDHDHSAITSTPSREAVDPSSSSNFDLLMKKETFCRSNKLLHQLILTLTRILNGTNHRMVPSTTEYIKHRNGRSDDGGKVIRRTYDYIYQLNPHLFFKPFSLRSDDNRNTFDGNWKRAFRTGKFRRAGFDRLMRADETMQNPNGDVDLAALSTFCDDEDNIAKRNTDMIRIMRSRLSKNRVWELIKQKLHNR